MLILISPSKTLDLETNSKIDTFTTPDFLADSKQLINKLKACSRDDLQKLMKISAKIADLNYQRYRGWKTPFSMANAKQAIFSFKGDVYAGLDIDSFGKRDINNCQKRLRILSGLYGLLKPLDLIQPYRLEMGTRLGTRRGANLYQFWGDKIASEINSELKNQKTSTLINLASIEYFKVVGEKNIQGEVISPAFKEYRNGEYKMIGLFAKKARGLMSRYIIKNQIKKSADLKNFDLDGYSFNNKLSVNQQWVFTR